MNLLTILRNIMIVLMAILVISIIIVLMPYTIKDSKNIPQKGCTDISEVNSLNYSACYDAVTKNIYLEIKNNNLFERPEKVKIEFFDFSPQSFIIDIPSYNSSLFKKLPAERNPFAIEIYFMDYNKKYCNTPLDMKIGYCNSDNALAEDASITLITSIKVRDFTSATSSGGNNDYLPIDIIDADRLWESVCKSSWDCDLWTECIDGFQKRQCVDRSNCAIPTGIPQRVKSCNGFCIEDWQCEWSECFGDYTTPTCVDNNKCGTSINKPTKIKCSKDCTSNFICESWSSCVASYDFLTLSNGDYFLNGSQSRICSDKTGCEPNQKEFRDCILAIDVYTDVFEKCGKEYIGVYNRLDNSLLVNLEKGEQKDVLNIDLTGDTAEFYCDYCFDGIFNGDEEEIDCGGSCSSCSERVIYYDYSKNIFEKFFDRIFSFLDN